MRKITSLSFIILLVGLSCNENIKIKKVLKQRYISNNDTIEDVDIIFKKGDYSSGHYINSKKDSTWYYYNDNKLIAIKNWFLGKKFGEEYNIKNGVESYLFHNLNEEVLFKYTFKDNKIDKVEGSPLFVINKKDTIKKGEVFETLFFIPPNNSHVRFMVKIILSDSKMEKSDIVFDSAVDSFSSKVRGYSKGVLDFKKEVGMYHLNYITNFILNDNKIKTDTFNTIFFVKSDDS
jgi:hypothetical protein